MKPEELSRYERMYRAIEELMGTKLLRFSFPVEKGSDDLADHEAKSDTVRRGVPARRPTACKGLVGSL